MAYRELRERITEFHEFTGPSLGEVMCEAGRFVAAKEADGFIVYSKQEWNEDDGFIIYLFVSGS